MVSAFYKTIGKNGSICEPSPSCMNQIKTEMIHQVQANKHKKKKKTSLTKAGYNIFNEMLLTKVN